ncbi:hypothetical protein ACLB1M_15820 [Escherichia coli]
MPDFTFRRQPTLFTRNVPTRYYGYVTQPWFIGHSQREIVTARYAGSLRNRNTPAILNRRLPSVFR